MISVVMHLLINRLFCLKVSLSVQSLKQGAQKYLAFCFIECMQNILFQRWVRTKRKDVECGHLLCCSTIQLLPCCSTQESSLWLQVLMLSIQIDLEQWVPLLENHYRKGGFYLTSLLWFVIFGLHSRRFAIHKSHIQQHCVTCLHIAFASET